MGKVYKSTEYASCFIKLRRILKTAYFLQNACTVMMAMTIFAVSVWVKCEVNLRFYSFVCDKSHDRDLVRKVASYNDSHHVTEDGLNQLPSSKFCCCSKWMYKFSGFVHKQPQPTSIATHSNTNTTFRHVTPQISMKKFVQFLFIPWTICFYFEPSTAKSKYKQQKAVMYKKH